MKTFLQYIFEGQVVPSPNIHAVPDDKRDDSTSDVYTKNRVKNAVNNTMIKYGTKDYLSDPLRIKSEIKSAVDRVNWQIWKDEKYRNQWGEQLPRDRDGNPLG